MSRSWVTDEYGEVLTLDEACKVLRVTRQRIASWIRFKKIKAVEADGEKFLPAREVQAILDNPKRRVQTFGTSEPEELDGQIRDEAALSLEAEDINKLMDALKPWLQKQVAEEVEKQSRVVIRREVSTKVGTRSNGVSQNQDALSQNQDAPQKKRDAVDAVPWQRVNQGTSSFPLFW